MENENLINSYIANLAKSVNDLTLENLLLKAKQQNTAAEAKEVAEQVNNQTEEIAELKDTVERQDNELVDLKRKSRDDDDFIKRLEGGIEQANGIIAQFEEEKNAAIAKVKVLEKEIDNKPTTDYDAIVNEKNKLFDQNVKLLKELDYTEKKLSGMKSKLAAVKPVTQVEENVTDGNDNQTKTIGDSFSRPD
jgi:TolA-binding protein